MKTNAPNMGAGTSSVFSGKAATETNRLNYGESAPFFASEIIKRLDPNETYTLLDIGSYKGELLAELLKLLPEYQLKTIAVDINEEALRENKVADSVWLADASILPFQDKSIDIVIMRYVLQWNKPGVQQEILKEIMRVTKKFAIIEHTGPDDERTELWRQNCDRLHSGQEVPKMKRDNYFFSSKAEVEKWLEESGISYEVLKSRIIPGFSNVYIERYLLNDQEADITRKILNGTDYVQQTDWLILPK